MKYIWHESRELGYLEGKGISKMGQGTMRQDTGEADR